MPELKLRLSFGVGDSERAKNGYFDGIYQKRIALIGKKYDVNTLGKHASKQVNQKKMKKSNREKLLENRAKEVKMRMLARINAD